MRVSRVKVAFPTSFRVGRGDAIQKRKKKLCKENYGKKFMHSEQRKKIAAQLIGANPALQLFLIVHPLQ